MAGADPQMREQFGLNMPATSYPYLAQSGCTTVEGVDDASEFREVMQAMSVIGLSDQDKVRNLFDSQTFSAQNNTERFFKILIV